jgi:endonuclease YncB( thermonuclease family)
VREAPIIKATKKAEKEKIRLSHIDTSKRSQPNIEQFFGKSG